MLKLGIRLVRHNTNTLVQKYRKDFYAKMLLCDRV